MKVPKEARSQPRSLLVPRFRELPRPPRSARAPRFIAASIAAAGIVTLAGAFRARMTAPLEPLSRVVPLTIRTEAASVAAMAGLGLLVIAGALSRRQRRAWWIALALLVVGAASHLLHGLDVVEAGLDLGLAAVLVMARREFDVRPGPATIGRALFTLPLLAFVAWGLGTTAIVIDADAISPQPSLVRAMGLALRGAVGLPLDVTVVGPTGRWIPAFLPLLGVVVIVSSIVVVFRPVAEGLRRDPGEDDRVRSIVRRFGSDTLAYFALREDKNHFIEGDAFVSYRYLWRLGLVSGDPVGDPRDVPGAMESFVKRARSVGWGVAVLAGGSLLAPLYARLGLRALYIGDEAIVDPTDFSLEGRKIRKVRQSCHRLHRLGYDLSFIPDSELGPDLQDALAAVATSWRGRAPERGFTMALGRRPSPADPDCLTVVARDAAGQAQGYLHLTPCYGPQPGFSLDQMRRRPSTPNGLTEWMIAMTAVELGRRGARRFSLNFAVLGSLLDAELRLTPLQRVEAGLLRPFRPFFQLQSLRDFNAKFSPTWEPRYIYYEAPTSLPRVALAYMEAEALVSLPFIGVRAGWRRRRRSPRSFEDGIAPSRSP